MKVGVQSALASIATPAGRRDPDIERAAPSVGSASILMRPAPGRCDAGCAARRYERRDVVEANSIASVPRNMANGCDTA